MTNFTFPTVTSRFSASDGVSETELTATSLEEAKTEAVAWIRGGDYNGAASIECRLYEDGKRVDEFLVRLP